MSQYRSKLALPVIGLCTLAVTALAADYERITGSFSFTNHVDCADPFLVEGSYDEVMHTYYDRFGNAIRLAFTGYVSITFTNVVNGMSYRPNSSGPGTIDLSTGQTIVRGSNGAMFDSEGTLIATNGRAILDENGDIITLAGRQVDVCAAIGSSSN